MIAHSRTGNRLTGLAVGLGIAFAARAASPPVVAAQPASSQPAGGIAPVIRAVDLIVTNCRIWTGDPRQPRAEAFGVSRGRIAMVGSREMVARFKTPNCRVIDLGGRNVLPGLIDAHVHLVSGGLSLSRLPLRDVRDYDEFVRRVRQAVSDRNLGADDWLIGRGWTTESWPKQVPLTRAAIDFPGGVKILLYRMDGHCALANSAALAAAGLNGADAAAPPGGVIERDAARAATGILKDAAIDAVERVIPKATPAEQEAAVRAAMQLANSFGLTAVGAMTEWDELDALRRVHDVGQDTLRVAVYVQEKVWQEFADRVHDFPVHDERLWIAGFKAYMDGSLGSRTAYMHAPYADRPGERGLMASGDGTLDRLRVNVATARATGMQAAVHAIGDQANHEILDLYEAAGAAPHRSFRPRIEHVQHLLPADVARFGRLGVVASMQPLHKADDARYAEAALGVERCKTSYAFHDLHAAGATLAFGSDWPVVSLNPWLGVHVAVTGVTLSGQPWMTQQNLGVADALTAYSGGAAFACGAEATLGRLASGCWADFVVVDRDPLTCPPRDLANVRVLETYVAGRRVWPARVKVSEGGP
ncbi:MAG: amidohydrolase [Phycisphaerae bacterium]